MSEHLDAVGQRYRLQRTEGRSLAFWGVILLAVTEAMLFAVLLFSWFYVWARVPEWPPAGVEPPELVVSGIRSVVLLATSLSVWLAERGLHRGDRAAARRWVVVTLLGSGYFLATHVHEFLVKTPEEFLWSDHAYGSLWWTILNFHGAHLLVGMLIWAFVLVRLARGAYGPDDMTEVQVSSIYWHFVDGVWVFVYTSLYVLPNLLGSGG